MTGGPPPLGGEEDEFLVVAVCESRSREVVVAAMSMMATHLLQTYIIQDTQSYGETLDLLLALRPKEILLPDSSRRRPLCQHIESLGVSATGLLPAAAAILRPVYIARGYFDQDRGVELLTRLVMKPGGLDADMLEKYVFLATCHALLKYMESVGSVRFQPYCLRVEFSYGYGGRLVIDRRTVKDLELVVNSRTGGQKATLFSVINRTKTSVGARNLKAHLLQPLTDLTTINTRLDLVELLIGSDPGLINDVAKDLGALADLDKMLTGIATVPTKDDLNSARRHIETIVLLKSTLAVLPGLVRKLEMVADEAPSDDPDDPSTELLKTIISALSPPAFAEVVATLDEYVTPSTVHEKSLKTRRLQECFAINAGVCGLLDVARKAFLQSVEDIYGLAERYGKQYGLSDQIQVRWTSSRGYFLAFPASTMATLPNIFIQCSTHKKTLQCTTEEVSSLSRSAEESAQQCVLLTNQVFRENVFSKVREHVDAMYKAVEAIALLDMLLSFADLALSDPGEFSRPKVCSEGTMLVRNGRHAIISTLLDEPFIPTSVCFSPFCNVLVVTGVNGGGKTTLLKQTALLCIMAQIGCFVPAAEAIIPIRDRILSCLSTADDMESNLSTFMSEMRSATYVLENTTPRSLVLIDELGRGTSTGDGAALSFAVVEALLARPAYLMFVTHYRQLLPLATLYGNVSLIHMHATITATGSLAFSHFAKPGVSELESGYGLAMARTIGLPERIIKEAERIRQQLERQQAAALHAARGDEEMEADPRWQYRVMQRLVWLMQSEKNEDELRRELQLLREKVDYTPEDRGTCHGTPITPAPRESAAQREM